MSCYIKLKLYPDEKRAKIAGGRPEVFWLIERIREIYEAVEEEFVEITSLTDGKHGLRSLHNVGFAVDTALPQQSVENLIQELARKRLGKDIDVVVEDDHIHWEFQPE